MANTTLQLKKSGVTGNVPSSLEYGELALNYADGKLFYRDDTDNISYISTDTTTDSFATINANSSLILATSPTDTLSIIPGNNITISTDTIGKSITINADTGSATDSIARNLAQNAYDTANTASANTITIQGVNDWQNTEIIAVNEFAQAAFNQANTAGGSGTTVTISNDNTSNNIYYINFTANTSGTANTLFTSNNNLTFNPSTGTIGVKAINLTANTNISANTIDLTDTSQVAIDSFSTSVYRSAFYQVQLSSPSGFHMLNLNIIHNGTTVFANTFGDAYSSSSLGSFTGSIVGTTLNVLFTPTNSSVTVAFIRNAIAKMGVEAPSGSLGFVGDPVTATFNAGFVEDPVTSTFDYGTVG